METAVAAVLARPVSHPLAIVPLIFDAVEKHRLDPLLVECRRIGLRSDVAIGRAVNCIEAAAHRSDMSCRSEAVLAQIASWLFGGDQALQGPVAEWLTTDDAVLHIIADSPKLASMMHRALVVAEGGDSAPLSLLTVCVVMNRTVPLSLHSHPLGRLMTFSKPTQRLAMTDNIDQLWRMELFSSDVDVPHMLSTYVSHLRRGFDLKALRWVELHAVLLCTRSLSNFPTVDGGTVACVLDMLHLLMARCIAKDGSLGPSHEQGDHDERPPSRPTTAGSGGGIGRLGAVNTDDERRELTAIVVRLMGCATKLCFLKARECSDSALVLEHPLWRTVVSVEWGAENSTRAMTELWCSAALALLDSGVRLLPHCRPATVLLVSCDLTDYHDGVASRMIAYAVSMLRYAMACSPVQPPPQLSAPLASLIGAVCLVSAQRVTVAASSTYHDAGATSRLLLEQRALQRLAVHTIVCNNIVDWQMALAMTTPSVLDNVREEGAISAACPWVEACMWLYWHFAAACATTVSTNDRRLMEPILTLDDCDMESAIAIANGLAALVSELHEAEPSTKASSVVASALTALYFLYQIIDLDSVELMAPHLQCWMGAKDTCVVSSSPMVRTAVHRCVGCFVVQQRINIAVHADFGPLVEMLVELMRNGARAQQGFALDVARQLLLQLDASTLLTDAQSKSLIMALLALASCLWAQSRTDNQAGNLMHSALNGISDIVGSSLTNDALVHLMETFPEIMLEYQHLIATTRCSTAAHAALLASAPLSVITPSDVGRLISQLQRDTRNNAPDTHCFLVSYRNSIQLVANLLRRWVVSTSSLWQRALLDFCTHLASLEFIEFLGVSLQSPWYEDAASLMNEVVKAMRSTSRLSCLLAAAESSASAVVLGAVLWTVHSTEDAILPDVATCMLAAMAGSGSVLGRLLDCCNGPRVHLIHNNTRMLDACTVADGVLPHFGCLVSAAGTPSLVVAHIRQSMLEGSPSCVVQCAEMIGGVLTAILFGPYRIDAWVQWDVSCALNVINELGGLLHEHPSLRPGVARELLARRTAAPHSLCQTATSAAHQSGAAPSMSPGVDDVLRAVHDAIGAEIPKDAMVSILQSDDVFIEQTRALLSAYYG